MSEPPSKRRRRVPPESRKRSERSCDQCRKRRSKCKPSADDDGGECLACRISKTACTYQAPRKARFQGSISDLSDRYRCLDAIVRAAFPGEPATTVSELLSLGSKHGFPMPDVSGQPTLPVEQLLGQSRLPNGTADANFNSPTSVPGEYRESADTPMPSCPNDEGDSPGLVRDSSGQAHHIGPTGSLAFYASLRHLIASRFRYHGGDRRASFAQDNAATTLESDTGPEQEGVDVASPESTTTNERTLNQPDMREEEKRLPPTQQMNDLIQAYFDNVHLDLPLFHRASFQEEYECFVLAHRSTRPVTTPYVPFPDNGWGWLGCLYMMLVFGSLTGTGSHSQATRVFRRQSVAFVRSHLSMISTKSSLWNVRCLVLLSLYLHNNSDRNAAYLVAGTAVRCALALGLHKRELDNSFRPIEREMRKRAFCSLYAYEQFLCSTLGRPSGMGDPDVDVTAPKEGFLYNGNTIAELSAAGVELQKILFKARCTANGNVNTLSALRTWKAALPEFLDLPRTVSLQDISTRTPSTATSPSMDELRTILSHQPPARVRSVLLLHIQYHYVAALVTRAALLHCVASSHGPSTSVVPGGRDLSTETAESCIFHAVQVSVLIILLHEFKLLRGESALDVFYGYSAGMLLFLRLLQKSSLQKEGQVQSFLSNIASRLRQAIQSTSKSPTMKRFASVLESFASLQVSVDGDTANGWENQDWGQVSQCNQSVPTPMVGPTESVAGGLPYPFSGSNGDAFTPSMPAAQAIASYGAQDPGTFDELPHLPSDFSWPAFSNDMGLGFADIEGLLNGNGLFTN